MDDIRTAANAAQGQTIASAAETAPAAEQAASVYREPTEAELAADQHRREMGDAFDEVWPELAALDVQLREQGSSLSRALIELINRTPYKVQL